MGKGEWVTVLAGERGWEEGSEVYQGLVKVNYLQCSQDSPSTSLPSVVMSK